MHPIPDEPLQQATLDTTRIDDVRIAAVRALVSPAVLLEELPVTPEIEALALAMLEARAARDAAEVEMGRADTELRHALGDPTRCTGFSKPRIARVLAYQQKFDSALAVYRSIPFIRGRVALLEDAPGGLSARGLIETAYVDRMEGDARAGIDRRDIGE